MRFLAIAACALLWPATASLAADVNSASYVAVVTHVADGDTISVHIDGWPAPYDPVTVRVAGIDTPESRKQDAKCTKERRLGLIAKQWARDTLPVGASVVVTWTGENEKYGRLLATVTLPNGKDFGAEQIRLGHARRYTSDNLTKSDWCK